MVPAGVLRGYTQAMITVTASITLAESEIEESFIRSPGPGGQNVNKVETSVQLRFDAANSPTIGDDVFRRLKVLAGRRMNREGVILLSARRFRNRERNRRDALDRLIELIRRAAVTPKKRKPTKPTKASKQRRLEAKSRRAGVKKGRAKPGPDD